MAEKYLNSNINIANNGISTIFVLSARSRSHAARVSGPFVVSLLMWHAAVNNAPRATWNGMAVGHPDDIRQIEQNVRETACNPDTLILPPPLLFFLLWQIAR